MSRIKLKLIDLDGQKIPVEDLTEVSLLGQGVLDVFLQTQRLHLDREFHDGRIQGKEYSDVFLQTYITTLEHAIAFLFAREKQAFELDLLDLQAEHLKEQIKLTKEQINLAKAELKLKEKELEIKEKELQLAAANVDLIRQKIVTERAQTDGSVIGGGSVLGKQNDVLDAQIQGYRRDAEQKAAQLLLQTWITRMNNDSAITNDANMLKDNYIGRTVARLMEGAGISSSGRNEADLGPPGP